MIKLRLSNNLIVENCPKEVIEIAKKTLTIENPAFHKILRITGSPWASQRDFRYYKISKTVPNKILCPRGFYSRFKGYLERVGLKYEVEVDFVSQRAGFASLAWSEVTLRDYQKPLLEQMLAKTEGVVAASTGSGKSVLTCALARALGQTMTVLCPTTVIADQFKAEFKKWFDYEVGFIGDGQKEIKDITVAMWQSLSADKELCAKLAGHTSVLVVDECHGAISDERRKILEMFKPSRLYGLSGSPRRSSDDGRTNAIFFYLGPIIAEHQATQIVPEVEVVKTFENIPIDNYPVMEDAMVSNDSRNTLIAGLAIGEMGIGKKVLILLKRRDHCQKIMAKLPQGGMIWYADSDDPDRNETLMSMRSGEREFCGLVGTFSLLSTGLDLCMLDVLIIGASLKSDVLVEQSAGRILRLFKPDKQAKIIDLYDNLSPIYKRQAWDRFRFYKSKGWKISGIDFNK